MSLWYNSQCNSFEISVDDYIRKITINENTDISLSYLYLIMHTPNLNISIDVVPGDKITITYNRNGKELKTEVTLEESK